MQFFRRQLPIILAFGAGMIFWIQYYIPSQLSKQMFETFNTSWAIIMAGAAFILGVLSAIEHHWGKVSGRKSGYGYSAVTLFLFGLMLLMGLFPVRPVNWSLYAALACLAIGVILGIAYLLSRARNPARADFGQLAGAIGMTGLGLAGLLFVQPLSTGQLLTMQVGQSFTDQVIHEGSLFYWFFENVFIPLDSTMFSLLSFYIASAAFRAFRARSFEATALLISGCLVMLGRVPLGEQLALHFGQHSYSLTDVAGWILNNPNTAAQRGILLGVILSQIAISLRIIFGIERTYMGGGD
jgi:hypothetical protein